MRPRPYPSDTTDAEWRVLARHVPARTGRGRAITSPRRALLVTGANVQDRDAARPLLWALHACFPSIRLLWADSGYAGKLVDWATTHLTLTVQIVAKLAGQSTFVVLHRRWVVERTFSW